MFTFSERHVTVCHYNDTRSTMTRWSFHNDQRHMTAFQPISEAAHSSSYDNNEWRKRLSGHACEQLLSACNESEKFMNK